MGLTLGLALFAVGCADVEDVDDELGDRHAIVDGDITIHTGTDAAQPDCVLFDLVGGGIYDGAAADGNLLLSIDGDLITTDDGVARCEIDRSADLPRLRVIGYGGPAIYSVWQKWVLAGDFAVPPAGDLPANVAYTFQVDHVHEGLASELSIIGTATDNIQFSSADRKLLIAAGLTGACGARGGNE